MKVLGYVRCSTAEQAIDGIGLDAQRGRITAWCEATGAELVEVIEDAGVSGTRPLIREAGRDSGCVTARCTHAGR